MEELGRWVDGDALSKMEKTGALVERKMRIAVLVIMSLKSSKSSKWRAVKAVGCMLRGQARVEMDMWELRPYRRRLCAWNPGPHPRQHTHIHVQAAEKAD